MVNLIRRAFITLAAALALALAAQAVPLPALAAAVHGCPDDTVCLNQWKDFGAPAGDANPGWKSSFLNIYQHPNSCLNLTSPMAYWPNGTAVTDNSGSLVVNNATWPSNWYVTFYDWVNCNTAGPLASSGAFVTGDTSWPDLNDIAFGYGYYAYHRITSIRIEYGSTPPAPPRA